MDESIRTEPTATEAAAIAAERVDPTRRTVVKAVAGSALAGLFMAVAARNGVAPAAARGSDDAQDEPDDEDDDAGEPDEVDEPEDDDADDDNGGTSGTGHGSSSSKQGHGRRHRGRHGR